MKKSKKDNKKEEKRGSANAAAADSPGKKLSLPPTSLSPLHSALNNPNFAPSPDMTVTIGSNKFSLMHAAMVNNSEYADVSIVFTVAGKKEVVYAHEAILQFRRVTGLMSQSPLIGKVEKKAGYVTAYIAEPALVFCNVQILVSVLHFVYAGSQVTSTDLPFLVNLLATAHACGLGDSPLAASVEDKLAKLTTLETSHLLIARAQEYKLERLYANTVHWAFKHWGDFISDKEGCRRLGMDLLSKLSAAHAKNDPPTIPPAPAAVDTILQDYKGLLFSANLERADLAIDCSKDVYVPCHNAVVSVFCEGFRNEVAGANIMSPRKKSGGGRTDLVLRSVNQGRAFASWAKVCPDEFCSVRSTGAANALLQFVYFGNTNFAPIVAIELAHALADFRIPSIEAACEAALAKGVTPECVLPLLGLTFHPSWVGKPTIAALRDECTEFIVENFTTLDLNALSVPVDMFHILHALQRSKSGGRATSSVRLSAMTPVSALNQSFTSATGAVVANGAKPPPPSEKPAAVEKVLPADLPPPPSLQQPPGVPPKPANFVADVEEETDEEDDEA